jgi:4-alpha-glucanotransferase
LDYWDSQGRHRLASTASLLGVLRALGVALDGPQQAAATLAHLRLERWHRPLEPVVVAWDGRAIPVRLRLPARQADASLALTIELEDGDRRELCVRADALPARGSRTVAGERFVTREWTLPGELPPGYHRLTLESAGELHQAHLIAAPMRAWQPEPGAEGERAWGVFLPLYALRSERSWGAADWTDFRRLLDWTGAQGGQVVTTLPMLAEFLGNGPRGDEAGPFEYSPYSPASRLFPSELFIDVTAVAELKRADQARALLASAEFRAAAAELNAADLLDYRRQAALKRRVLERLAAVFFADAPPGRRAAFDRFLWEHPLVEDYALFRAAGERRQSHWQAWPEPQRSGRLAPTDADLPTVQYHLYAQWIAHEQLGALARRARKTGCVLYLDMPLGVNRDGYDVWRHRELFGLEASGGAPPDGFFSKGQNWGFPPLHPQRSRAQGHRYLAASIRGLMSVAGALRIDHVMGLHRLFWVPEGMTAAEGVYVRYPAEEIYAILTLESHRHAMPVFGENLGTVPPSVPAAMERHGVRGLYVLQFSVRADGDRAIDPVPPGVVASINTHDTPTFAGWWIGSDIDVQLELGLIDAEGHRQSHRYRGQVRDSMLDFLRRRKLLGDDVSPAAVLAACLRWLAAGPAGLVLVNLEDLWLEPRPQNVPGTGPERPNWRRRAAMPFETWTERPEYVKILREIDELRRGAVPRRP